MDLNINFISKSVIWASVVYKKSSDLEPAASAQSFKRMAGELEGPRNDRPGPKCSGYVQVND